MILRTTIFFFIISLQGFAQYKDQTGSDHNKAYYSFDVNNFYGTILKHNPDISHLITGHPMGVILSANRKTFGTKEWQRLYNAPDYGVSFIYQNMDNEFLGENYGLYAHYNFYFFKRILMLRLGQGLAYTTKPYDEDDNFRNVAYGSHFMSSTFAMLNLKRENLIGGLGIQAGIGVIHYSNANVKAPNKSTNTFVFNVGLNYILDTEYPEYVEKGKGAVKGTEPIGYGFIFRGGINESDVVGSGQYPFYTFGAFADKRLNKKSSVQLGAELFFSEALERFIDFRSTGDFEDGTTGDEDSKRVGVFLGHELRINKISILTQLGYYIYYPYDFEGQVYNRFGARYYFSKNIFGSITVRSHAAKAEAVEFSIGYRL
ncbi:acyloxyacyl hydrolase [Aquimarina sp. SS2-1]|uniref:acyloxyacyl hydrolase n=1 Tax=Aquimarina besae TaxID=3342247 RepID=UPI003672F735